MTFLGWHINDAAFSALAAAVSTLMVVFALRSGTTGAGIIVVKRSEEPRAFWVFVVFWAAAATLAWGQVAWIGLRSMGG